MRKFISILALALVLATFFSACGSKNESGVIRPQDPKPYPIDSDYQSRYASTTETSITTLDGRTISVPKSLNSIVCFSPAAFKIFGSNKNIRNAITAVDAETSVYATSIKNIITENDIRTENPDLIFIEDTYDVDSILTSEDTYITIPHNITISDIKNLIEIFDTLTENDKESAAKKIDNSIAMANTKSGTYSAKYKVFIDLGTDDTTGNVTFKTSGAGTYVNEIINHCGGENVFADSEGFVSVTAEQILEANPDFIFTVDNPNVFTSNKDLKGLECISSENKATRLISLKPGDISVPSPTVSDAIDTISNAISSVHDAQKVSN